MKESDKISDQEDSIDLLQSIREIMKAQNIFSGELEEKIIRLEEDLKENLNYFNILARFGHRLKTQDSNGFFQTILETSRDLTNSDGGTVYSLEEKFSEDPLTPLHITERKLVFQVMQNETLKVFRSGDQITLPPVDLLKDGKPNNSNVSAYCANSGETINLEDVYDAEGFDFTGTRTYDEQTGYRSRSMLVYPLKNPSGEIVGVLQLINRRNIHKQIVAFSKKDEELLFSLAMTVSLLFSSQILSEEHKKLFDAFIKILAQGLGEKSPHTYNHIRNVEELSVKIAKAVSEYDKGMYENVRFSKSDLEIISLSGWMHDIGKMTTPEHIVIKNRKLQQISDRIEIIISRIDSKIKDLEIESLQKQLALTRNDSPDVEDKVRNIREDTKRKIDVMRICANSLYQANKGTEFLNEEKLREIEKICEIRFNSHFQPEEIFDGENHHEIRSLKFSTQGVSRPIVNPGEKENLQIQRGTLNDREREIIKSHADRSWRWLNALPFPKKNRAIPLYAGAHHEALNGSGYPNQLREEQLPIQARILAVADIFEALTAIDRPYTPPKKLSLSLKIFGSFTQQCHIDPEITKIFIRSKYFIDYVETKLQPELNDLNEIDIESWIDEFIPKNFQNTFTERTWTGN